MRQPIFVRPISDAERESLEAGLRSSDAFVLRGCQILLASSRGENAYQIARSLGCNPQTARNAIHVFDESGLQAALGKGSSRPHTIHAAFDFRGRRATQGGASSEPSALRQKQQPVDLADGRRGELRGGNNRRAGHGRDYPRHFGEVGGALGAGEEGGITSPDPEYQRKKGGATG